MAVAVLLQSSTAVAVLVSNFVSKGGLATATGLAILFGSDVGSAVVAQLFMVRQPLLIPLLLVIGITILPRGEGSNTGQIGRIMISLALIFLSLDMIRNATEPMISNHGTKAVMAYLGGDLLTAFVIGVVFAWGVHSSGAALTVFAIASVPDVLAQLGSTPARQAINAHLAFNTTLALIALLLWDRSHPRCLVSLPKNPTLSVRWRSPARLALPCWIDRSARPAHNGPED